MVTQATSDAIGKGAATKILSGELEIVGPDDQHNDSSCTGGAADETAGACGSSGGGKLEW